MDTPQWEPQRLTLLSEMAAMRIWSKARVKKAAKVLQKATVLSRVAQPTATLTWGRGYGISPAELAEEAGEPRTPLKSNRSCRGVVSSDLGLSAY